MRFARYQYRPTDVREVTNRRLAASKRALNNEADKLPLFADQIREQQPTPEERIALIDAGQQQIVAQWRDHHAKTWRKGRRMLRELPSCCQKDLLAKWDKSHMPADPAYFCEFIRSYRKHGFVYLDVPPVLRYDPEKLAKTMEEIKERGRLRNLRKRR